MTIMVSLDQRRMYRQNEVNKHGLYALNRKQALLRPLKNNYVSPNLLLHYQFNNEELPFLDEQLQVEHQALCDAVANELISESSGKGRYRRC